MSSSRMLGFVAVLVTLGLTPLAAAEPVIASTASRDLAPTREMSGSAPQLADPSAIAIDAEGRLYVANPANNSVSVYASDWSFTNSEPLKVLRGAATRLSQPRALEFDSTGRLYVVNGDSITVYPPNWAPGDTPPEKVLRGSNSALVDPRGIAFDPTDRMYVVNSYESSSYGSNQPVGSIAVFPPGWASGDTPPQTVMQGPKTELDRPYDAAFDDFGRMFVANKDSITIYGISWSGGDVGPQARLVGPATGLARPAALAFDEGNILYVANSAASTITTYDVDSAAGDAAPLSTLSGRESLLSNPAGLHITDDGSVIVANSGTDRITAYASSRLIITLTESGLGPVPLRSSLRMPRIQINAGSVTISGVSTLETSVRLVSTTPNVCEGQGQGLAKVVLKRPGTCTVKSEVEVAEPWSVSPSLTRSFLVIASMQTISMPVLQPALLADRWVTLRVSATSGLPVTIVSESPSVCMPSYAFGHRVRLISTGNCSLLFVQAGSEFWQWTGAYASLPVVAAVISAECGAAPVNGRTGVRCNGASRGLDEGTQLTAFTRVPRGSWRASVATSPTVDAAGRFVWETEVGSRRTLSIHFRRGEVQSLPVLVKLR